MPEAPRENRDTLLVLKVRETYHRRPGELALGLLRWEVVRNMTVEELLEMKQEQQTRGESFTEAIDRRIPVEPDT